jgi:uncharacterized membrane protein
VVRVEVFDGRRPWIGAVVSLVGGVAVGALARGLDAALPALEVGLAASALPVLHSTLLAAVVSVAVFSLWMRSVMVGLVSSFVSPRAVSEYLEDRFQHRLTWTMLAAIGALSTLLATAPDELPPGDVPPLPSTVVAVLIAAAAVFAVLVSLRAAVWGLSVSRVVRQMADRAAELLPDEQVPVPVPQRPAPDPGRAIVAAEVGWVQGVSTERLFDAIPADARVDVLVRVGDFVTPRVPLMRVPEDCPASDDGLRAAFDVRHRRDPGRDLAFALQQLVDVARSALSDSSNDTSTAHEAQLHLVAVFERMLHNGLPTHIHRDHEGREVVRCAEWQPVDHVRTVFDRLRPVAAADPVAARSLVGILERLATAARDAGNQAEVLDELARQVQRLLSSAEAMLPDDLDPADVRRTIDQAELPSHRDEDDGAVPERDADESPVGRGER